MKIISNFNIPQWSWLQHWTSAKQVLSVIIKPHYTTYIPE